MMDSRVTRESAENTKARTALTSPPLPGSRVRLNLAEDNALCFLQTTTVKKNIYSKTFFSFIRGITPRVYPDGTQNRRH